LKFRLEKERTRTGAFFQATGEMLRLFGETLYWCKASPRNLTSIFKQMSSVGADSLPIASVMAIFVGMVLALQTSSQLARFRSEWIIGAIVGLTLVQELGPVMTAFLVAGRVGAAIAAEIGTMRVSEEIDALETLAINPVRFLAMPRLLACALMLPLLTIYVVVIGMSGGALISQTYADVAPSVYWDVMWGQLTATMIFKGLFKSLCFGVIISTVGCYMGFTTTGGAEGVGVSTTKSVVVSFMLILTTNFFLTRVLL
jgi:phospholipid/cholesterol/gamma-HCH transport system permease protein